MAGDWAALTRQVKEANDIVSVVGSYLALHPAGPIFKAICPFHQDTRPSLDVDPRRQRYKCWACGKHGDVFAFVMEMEKVDFVGARAQLAVKAGIALAPSPQDEGRVRLLGAMKWAEGKYQTCLLDSPLGEQARLYLGERKLTGASVRAFGLGFAPLQGDWLVQQARAAGQSVEILEEIGLIAARSEGNGFYDRFRDRVMFPIRDVRGRTVGFGGRILPSSPYANRAPKYYNSTDTPLFKKSELLYGLDLARQVAASAGDIAVVEGYTDVMMAHQCGVSNVVATMGTALNASHVYHLRRFAPKIVLVFDADAGGTTGADRALELFISTDVDLRIATLPPDLDPCEVLAAEGAPAFRKVLESAVDPLDYKLNQLLSQESAQTVAGQQRTIDAVLGILALTPDSPGEAGQLRRQAITTRIASRLHLDHKTVWKRLWEIRSKRKIETTRSVPNRTDSTSQTSCDTAELEPPLERQLLTMLLAEPALIPDAAREVPPEEMTHPGARRLLNGLYQLQAGGQPADIDGLRTLIHDPALIARALKLHDIGREITERPRWFQVILKKFREERSKPGKKQIREQLTAASNHDQAVELLRKLQNPTEGSGS